MKSNIFKLIGKGHFFVEMADTFAFATQQKKKCFTIKNIPKT
jgi:hypothetical protein